VSGVARASVQVLRRALDALGALLLLAVLLVVAAQVAARYLLGLPMPWAEELTRLLFVWLVMIGATRARHLRIDMIEGPLGPRGRRALRLGTAALSVLLLLVLVHYGRAMIELTAYDRYTALGLSVQYLYWSVVVGAALWALLVVLDLVVPPPAEPAELPPA
jgi:TRAP-type transport system small permease protein